MLEDRAYGHSTGSRTPSRLLATTKQCVITCTLVDLVFFLAYAHLCVFEGALFRDFSLLERSHPIIAHVLVKSVQHGVDGLLGASMAIRSLVMWLRPLISYFTFISVWKRALSCKVLLCIICIDLFTVKLRIL